MLEAELAGSRPAFAAGDIRGSEAQATRQFLRQRQAAAAALP
jgi:hypothetical protein